MVGGYQKMIKMTTISDDIPVLQTLHSHSSDVMSCDFGGKFNLATGCGDKLVRMWEWKAGEGYTETNSSPLTTHKYAVTSVRFSPQGTMLASSSVDGSTVLWNVGTGARIAIFVQPSGGAVRVCRFSPDSTFLVTADDDGIVALWDLVQRNLVRTYHEHEGSVQAASFTPDSSYLLTACMQGVMKLWKVFGDDDTPCLFSLDDTHDLGVIGSDFSSAQEKSDINSQLRDSYLLATCGNDHLVRLWVVSVGRKEKHQQFTPCQISSHLKLVGHSSAVTCVRFSPGGIYLASTSIDKTTRLWELGGSCLATLEGHSRYVTCCSFSRDGSLLATGSNDKRLIVWDLTKSLSLKSELVKPNSAFTPSSKKEDCNQVEEQQVVKHAEGDLNAVKLLQRLDQHGAAVNSCHFHGNDLLATASGDKLVRLFSRSDRVRFTETSMSPLEGHRYAVNQVDFSSKGGLLSSCSLDGTTILWDIHTGRRARPTFQCSGGSVRTCRFSPDGHLLVTAGDDNTASIFNTHAMELIMVVIGHSDAIISAAFTADSQYLVTASSDGNVKLWAVAPCSEQCLLTQEEAHDMGVQCCDFSPAEGIAGCERGSSLHYLLATCGNDSMVKLWHIGTPRYHGDNVHTSTLWRTFSGHGGNVMCVRFAPGSGEILASTATDQTARLWNVYTGECVHVLESHSSMVTTCAFSDDSSLLATGSLDKTVIIWELPQQLVFQTVATIRLRGYRKRLVNWEVEDIEKWMTKLGLSAMIDRLHTTNLTGQQLLTFTDDEIHGMLQIDSEAERQHFSLLLFWLKKEDAGLLELPTDIEIPHEFICPITHEIMRDPVTCSDGFTYERAAINEWFLSGKFTSPMTNASLTDTNCVANIELRMHICRFLYGENTNA